METTITVKDRTITIQKISLKNLASLIATIENVPSIINKVSGKSNAEILGLLSELIEEFRPDMVSIIHFSTQLPKEEIEDLSIGVILKILHEVYLVNDLNLLFESKKKAEQSAPLN